MKIIAFIVAILCFTILVSILLVLIVMSDGFNCHLTITYLRIAQLYCAYLVFNSGYFIPYI